MKFVQQVVILAIVATIILALGACSPSTSPAPVVTAISSPVPAATVVSAPAPTATSLPPTPAPTLAATAARTVVPPTVTWTPTPSHKSMLVAAFNAALGKLKTYRATVLEENRDVDVILPDRFAQNGFDPIVKIGGMLYTYDARGNLRAGPASSVPFFDRVSIPWLRDRFAESPQVVLLGPATIEGTPCIGYSGSFAVTKVTPPKTPGGTPEVAQIAQPVKIWFATSDGFPRRVEMGAPTPLTITFFDFNAEIPPIEPLQ